MGRGKGAGRGSSELGMLTRTGSVSTFVGAGINISAVVLMPQALVAQTLSRCLRGTFPTLNASSPGDESEGGAENETKTLKKRERKTRRRRRTDTAAAQRRRRQSRLLAPSVSMDAKQTDGRLQISWRLEFEKEMSEKNRGDPAIKLFGKTIPLPANGSNSSVAGERPHHHVPAATTKEISKGEKDRGGGKEDKKEEEEVEEETEATTDKV